ncbi:hypothetical protein Agabi119p4_10130 [Agaricus bisporus var. burnettii]|uniref:Ricin B lectin domain-containing protein n=1 Tax=Agaricus bisporus var. burnettii TaxID=192524 RepID=A0A8H7EW56_AGABI|nr:hypothetical protein Agabi119p4_10130 [Agaricus bisporus var. burnettii]
MSSEVVSGQSYRITNVKAGNALDLSGVDDRSIIGYPYHGGMNQQWTFTWEGDAWSIRSVSSSKYLGIDGNPNNGTKLVADTQMFKWHIWRDAMDENNFRIFVPNTHQNVDLSNHGDPTPGNPIIIWSTWSGVHQTWKIERP